jgi:hypothetical protein
VKDGEDEEKKEVGECPVDRSWIFIPLNGKFEKFLPRARLIITS